MKFSDLLGYTQDAMNAYSAGSSLGKALNPHTKTNDINEAINSFSQSLNELYSSKLDRDELNKKKKKKNNDGNTGNSNIDKTASLTGNSATATPVIGNNPDKLQQIPDDRIFSNGVGNGI